jgi:peptidoglycan hydrolase-like protein with peptidoglycan-binding domain
MSLPFTVRPVVRPSVLTGQLNGLLAAHVLVNIAGGSLVAPAARAWRAMVAAAAADGIELKPTSTVDTYRPLSVQERTFIIRFSTSPTGRVPQITRTWHGKVWYLKPGYAPSATPGTSNHGWGLAVDVHTASGARLDWLKANAPRFGWSWEGTPGSAGFENWHIRYVDGDTIPAAVAYFEGPTGPRYPGTPVKQGSTGDAVSHVQRKVGARVDGDFGPATHTRVVAWQNANQLKADGIVGPVTWRKMFGAL